MVNIYDIADWKEYVKTNSNWQDDIKSMYVSLNSKKWEKTDKLCRKKIEILADEQCANVQSQSQDKKQFSAGLLNFVFKLKCYKVIRNGYEKQQRQKPPVPPTIEHIAAYKQKNILPLKGSAKDKPIKNKYDDQEESKG